MRNAYDVLLNSNKANSKISFNLFFKMKNRLIYFFAICSEIFPNIKILNYLKTKKTELYVNKFKSLIENNQKVKKFNYRIKKYLYLKFLFELFIKSIFLKKYRIWLILL